MRRRTRSAENINLYPFDPEIERTLRANLLQRRREMEGQHDGNLPQPPPPPFHHPPPPHFQQFPQVQPGNINNLPLAPPRPSLRAIQRPTIGSSPLCIRLSESARNYELKTLHFNMLPSFHGLPSEDPLSFIREFFSTIQTFPLQGASEEDLRMRCFPHTLKDRAKAWLMNLPEESLATWEEVYDKFITRFYSPQKTGELRSKIMQFFQMDGEPFHECWERFKLLLHQCPHHQFSLELLSQTFYDALTDNCQTLVDTASMGNFNQLTGDAAFRLYEKLAENSQQKSVRRKEHVNEIGTSSSSGATSEMAAQIANLTNVMTNAMALLLDKQSAPKVESCSYCGAMDHNSYSCAYANAYGASNEEANYLGQYGQRPQGSNFQGGFQSNWRNPNTVQGGQGNRPTGPPGFQPRPTFQKQYQAPQFQQQYQAPQFQQQYQAPQPSIPPPPQ